MAVNEVEQIERLFAQEVPEIAGWVIEIKAIARKSGTRTKVALRSRFPGVDAIGVCVGKRGCRILRIVDQLDGERIDLIRWNDSPEEMIVQSLQPVRIEEVILHLLERRATVVIKEDQMSFLESTGDVNRELASRLCGWIIEVIAQ